MMKYGAGAVEANTYTSVHFTYVRLGYSPASVNCMPIRHVGSSTAQRSTRSLCEFPNDDDEFRCDPVVANALMDQCLSAMLTAETQSVRWKLHQERSSRSCQPAYPGKVAAPTGDAAGPATKRASQSRA